MEETRPLTAIVGAGALGAMYAARIDDSGYPVAFLADGPRVDQLEAGGVTVNGRTYRIPVLRPGSEDPRAPSLIIVAVKHHQLASVVPLVKQAAGPGTAVISVMNGIDSEVTLAEAVGQDKVLYALAKAMDPVRVDGEVRYTRMGWIVFGRKQNDPDSPDPLVTRVQQYFDSVGIAWQTEEDMERALWNKFMLNVGINQVSAVLRAPYREFHREGHGRELMRLAMKEVLSLARSRNVDLSEADMEAWFPVVGSLSPDGQTSMLQDIEAGRKTEVEMFALRVVEMADEVETSAPVNRTLYHMIRSIEEMNGVTGQA